jgi:hypothetical protein
VLTKSSPARVPAECERHVNSATLRIHVPAKLVGPRRFQHELLAFDLAKRRKESSRAFANQTISNTMIVALGCYHSYTQEQQDHRVM